MYKFLMYLYSSILVTIFTLLGATIVYGFFWLAPKVEETFFPVIKNFSIENVIETEKSYLLYGTFEKVRPCSLQTINVYSITEDKKFVSILDEDFHPTNRPVGWSYFGPWKLNRELMVRNDLENDNVLVYVSFECSLLWDTIQTFGPYNIKEKVELSYKH